MKSIKLLIIFTFFFSIFMNPIKAEENTITYGFSYIGYHEVDNINNDLYTYQNSHDAYVTTWRNETQFLKLAVTSSIDTEVTAMITPFTNRYGDSIDTVKMNTLENVNASLGFEGSVSYAPHIDVPERISNTSDMDLISNITRYYWIEINVPEDTKAGRYDSVITLTSGSEQYEAHIELVVSNLIIPEDTFSLDLWQYPMSSYYYYSALSNGEPFSEEHIDALKKELEIYKELGGNAITTMITEEPWQHQTYYDTPSMIQWKLMNDGTFRYDFTAFDTWVNLCMEVGIDERIDCFSILPFDNSIMIYREDGSTAKLYLTPGTEEWNYYWTEFLWTFADHLYQNGWLEKAYIFVDERQIMYFQEAIDLLNQIIVNDQPAFHIASSINTLSLTDEIMDQIDYLSISIAAIPNNEYINTLTAHRKTLGLETTIYNCSTNYPNAFTYSDPNESVWTMYYALEKGMDGYLRWALDAWNENPRENLDYWFFEAGDILLLYPDEKDSTSMNPEKTVRLCMIQKGIQDVKKYQYLLQNMDSTTQQEMNDALSQIQRPYGIYNVYGAMVSKHDAWRRLISEEVLRLQDMTNTASLRYDISIQ